MGVGDTAWGRGGAWGTRVASGLGWASWVGVWGEERKKDNFLLSATLPWTQLTGTLQARMLTLAAQGRAGPGRDLLV